MGSVNRAGSAVEEWLMAGLSEYAVDDTPALTADAMRVDVVWDGR